MKIEKLNTTPTILAEIGQRIAHRRIEMRLTQAVAAERAGIGKRTLEAIEAGNDCQFSSLISLLRVLNLFEHLNQLVPEATISPMEMLKMQGKQRKRASSPKTVTKKQPWKWKDEK